MKTHADHGNLEENVFNGGFVTASEGESVTVMAGTMGTDRQAWHGTGAVAERLRLIHK